MTEQQERTPPIPRKNTNLRHRLFLARQAARLEAVQQRKRAELATSRARLTAQSSGRRQNWLARWEAQKAQRQEAESEPQDGLGPEERMKRKILRESLRVRVSTFLLSLKNDPSEPEQEPALTAQWNDYIEGLNLRPGDIARYRDNPPEKEALVERLFTAAVGEEGSKQSVIPQLD